MASQPIIPWNITFFTDETRKRFHFIQVLRSIQLAILSYTNDISVFMQIPDTDCETHAKQFLATLWDLIAIFQRALKDTRAFIDNGTIQQGKSRQLDIEEMFQRSDLWLDRFRYTLSAFCNGLGFHRAATHQSSTLATSPRELVVAMSWMRLFGERNATRLRQGQPMTEHDLKYTLREWHILPLLSGLNLC